MQKIPQEYEWILSKPIAHRGLHDDVIPENSSVAFEAAIAAGCSIEIDVQLTKDRVAVVFHDDILQRVTGFKKRLTRMKFAEVQKLRLNGTEYGIPTFKDFLEQIDGRTPILIEIKKNRGSKGIEQIVLDILKDYKGEFAIQSFHPYAIRNVHKIDPSIYCGLLSSKMTEQEKVWRIQKAAVKNARLFFMAKPDFISFEINSFPNRRIAGFREELKMPILGWTIKTKEDIERAREFCDGIIFENIGNLVRNIGGFFAQEPFGGEAEERS
ncbi:MAG: glycerophosphodiester phosphodiesterase [Clostridiales Family XIII bacterium]|jgi:glycerophosphoryl diester phosphodiesterase|nr:glycerophosphodiester phosphodiesterase [Clostridiales Family XIII bacterium]